MNRRASSHCHNFIEKPNHPGLCYGSLVVATVYFVMTLHKSWHEKHQNVQVESGRYPCDHLPFDGKSLHSRPRNAKSAMVSPFSTSKITREQRYL